jgi:AcrR family transcriptional regulator
MTMHAKQSRPGGRTEKNRQAVAAAVLQLISEGHLDFEVQEVAALSGVHRTTLFRRWPDRGALIAEAMAAHVSRVSVAFSGDWREDLRRVAFSMRDFLADPVEQAMNRMLAISDNQVFHDQMVRHWAGIFEDFQKPISDAQARGVLPEAVDPPMVIGMIIAVINSITIFTRTVPDDAYVERLVAQIVRGCT